jgi:hypothetical protein
MRMRLSRSVAVAPDRSISRVFKNPGHLLETLLDIVGLLEFQSSRLRLAVDHRHGPGDTSFILGEHTGPNPVVVAEAQQLSSTQMRQ